MDSKRLAAPISARYRLDCPQAAGRERLLMAGSASSPSAAERPHPLQCCRWPS